MARRITKDELEERAYFAVCNLAVHTDMWLDTELVKTLGRDLGIDQDLVLDGASEFFPKEPAEKQSALRNFRKTRVWTTLSRFYDYAYDGIVDSLDSPDDLCIDGEQVVSLITVDFYGSVSDGKERKIHDACVGRMLLDEGSEIMIDWLAALANVDERTIRNAISAKELKATSTKPVYLDNQSAREWLRNRRGFKPTQIQAEKLDNISNISTPAEFGAFLKEIRCEMSEETKTSNIFDTKTLEQVEQGIFMLPINACQKLADFYGLDRSTFLHKVMQVFYKDELSILASACEEDAT